MNCKEFTHQWTILYHKLFYNQVKLWRPSSADRWSGSPGIYCRGSFCWQGRGVLLIEDGWWPRKPSVSSERRLYWGTQYPAGANVVRGTWLESMAWQQDHRPYKVLEGKLAAVYAATIRYICQDLEQRDGLYILPLNEHQDILGSLNSFWFLSTAFRSEKGDPKVSLFYY